MEAKFQCMEYMQSASWKPRKADGTNAVLKTGRLKTQEELIFLAESEVWKKIKKQYPSLHSQTGGGSSPSFTFLFWSGLQLTC